MQGILILSLIDQHIQLPLRYNIQGGTQAESWGISGLTGEGRACPQSYLRSSSRSSPLGSLPWCKCRAYNCIRVRRSTSKSCKVDALHVELVTVLSEEFAISAVKVLLSYEWEQISGAGNMVDQKQIKHYCKPGVKSLILWPLDVCSLFGGRRWLGHSCFLTTYKWLGAFGMYESCRWIIYLSEGLIG